MASFTGGVLVHYHICEGYVCAQGFLHTTAAILTGVGLSCVNQILLLSVDSNHKGSPNKHNKPEVLDSGLARAAGRELYLAYAVFISLSLT